MMHFIAFLAILVAGILIYGIYLLLKHEEEFGAGCPHCRGRYITRTPETGIWYCKQCGTSWASDKEWVELFNSHGKAKES